MEQSQKQSRKIFIKKAFAGTVAATALFAGAGTVLESFKEKEKNPTSSTTGSAITAEEYRARVMPRAQLSTAACQIAVDKLTQSNAKEFNTYELLEAIAVVDVLKQMGTPAPPMNDESLAFIKKLNDLHGAEFDKTFMQAQLSNHEYLRDLTIDYLNSSDAGGSTSEKETRRMGILVLFAFKEHVAISKRVYGELTA